MTNSQIAIGALEKWAASDLIDQLLYNAEFVADRLAKGQVEALVDGAVYARGLADFPTSEWPTRLASRFEAWQKRAVNKFGKKLLDYKGVKSSGTALAKVELDLDAIMEAAVAEWAKRQK